MAASDLMPKLARAIFHSDRAGAEQRVTHRSVYA
jgi:hypothetical protein